MNSSELKKDDVIFIGTCLSADTGMVELLLTLGKQPLGFGGEFSPAFYLETDYRDNLPCGITMYDRGGLADEAARREALSRARIAIIAGGGTDDCNRVVSDLRCAVEMGALPLVEHKLHVASPLTSLFSRISFHTTADLIHMVYFFLLHPDERSAVLRKLASSLEQHLVAKSAAQSPIRILYLAFVESSYPQLFAKIDQQVRSMRRFNPDVHCYIIGPNEHNLSIDGYDLNYVDIAHLRNTAYFRQAHFSVAHELAEKVQPDIIYFRYPFFDGPALDFIQKHHNVVFEIQSIAAHEVGPEAAALELMCGPHILERTAGLVAVTDELLKYELNRSPRPLPGYVMSNGIDPASLPMISPVDRKGEVHLLCAAHFSPWHGMDRIIEGFACYPRSENITLHMAGDGEELSRYKALCTKYGLEKRILFHGRLGKHDLEELAKICQVGIGSLGLHRLGLSQFCILKNREYCLRGIPFIYAGQDVDFDQSLPFLKVFPADETPIDLGPVIDLAHAVVENPSLRQLARNYAIENLAWDKKIEGMVGFLKHVHNGLQSESAADFSTVVMTGQHDPAARITAYVPPDDGTKRILIACTHFWPSIGGVEAIVGDLGSHLAARGKQVHVATISHPERTADAYRGMKIISLETNRTADNKAQWPLHLRRLIESGSYDACILISNPLTPLIWAADSAAVPERTRVIIQPVINADDYNEWKYNLRFRQELSALLKRNITVALSQNGIDARFFCQEGITASFLPNAVDALQSRSGFRKQYEIAEDVFLVVHIANLYKVKNHLGLINALKSMPGNIILLMIGHPVGEWEYVEEVLRRLKECPQIRFIPGLAPEGVRQALHEADLLVLASHGEVSPVSILEAMSLRKPWLATPECGTVNETAGGIVAPLGRFRGIITYLSAHPERCSELGMLGYLHWKTCFTWQQVVQGWEELIAHGTLTSSYEMPGHVAEKMRRTLDHILQNSVPREMASPGKTETDDALKIIAIIAAHNEGDIIYHVIGDLIANGVSVYLIDNQSRDNTVQAASRWLGKGLMHIERFPEESGFPIECADEYRWREILLRKEQLATQLGADWYIHADADEFRESPWDGMTLHAAISRVDQAGYNAIDFELLNFRPTDNAFIPGEDVRTYLTGFEWGEDFNSLQIKAWKHTGVRVDLASHGGHNVSFPGRKIFPVRFILRHYPIRSQEHGIRKVFQDRKQRFSRVEREGGWHIQYDHIASESHQFLHAADTLIPYNGNSVRQILRERPLVVAVYSFDLPEQACSRIRFTDVGRQLRDRMDLRWGSRFDPATGQFLFDLALGRRADVVVFARFFPAPQTTNVVEEFLNFGKPVLYDLDDLLTHLDNSSPFKAFADQAAPQMENLLRRAHLVTVSNAELQREVSAFAPSVKILPNLIDGVLWGKRKEPVEPSSTIVIGYAGGFTHNTDLCLIEPALETIAAYYPGQVSFVFMGCATERIRSLPGFRYIDEVPDYTGYVEKLQDLHIDIALAPLVDNRFNRCKSNIKWLEYSACGFAGIYSDLPPYNTCIESGRTGLLVENTTEKWVRAIELLISNPQLRKSIAANSRCEVLTKYTLEAGAHDYLDTYRALLNDRLAQAGISASPVNSRHDSLLPSVKEKILSVALKSEGQSRIAGLVSIVILTFNQIRFTQECVASIQACTPEPHEIIFVDNGSTDGTVEWLKEQLQVNAGYRLIDNGTNFGFAKGCNQGIKTAQGEFILLLNNDVVVTSEWLGGMLECLRRQQNAGIIGPMTNNISGIQRVKRIGYDDMSGLNSYASYFRQTNRYRRIENRRIVGFCMLFRHELADRIGLLDESFGSGNFEDDDYCLRAELAGYRNLIAGDVFIHHYGSQTFSGNKINYNDAMMRNMTLYRNKWNYGKLDEATLRRLLLLDAVREARRLNMAGKVDAAVELLIQKGIRSAPDNPEPYRELAEILMAAGRYVEALQVVPEMPSDTEQALIGEVEAVCHAALGNEDAAYHSSRKAYGSSRALVVQGTLAARRGDLAGAEELLQLSIEADPACGTAWLSLGMLLWGGGKQKDAWQAIKRSAVVNPLNGEAVAILLDLGGRLGRLSEVLEVLEQAWDVFPDCIALGRAYASLLAAVGRDVDALTVYELILVTYGADNELLDEAVSVRKRIGPMDQVGVQGRQSVSLCMIVKNEEKNLPACLASLKPVVDEIVVVDTGSMDRTADIAELFGARVYSFNWTGNFSDARNLSLEKACGNWLLVMDADEVLSPQDYELVRQTVVGSAGKKVCWSVMTRNYTELHPQGWVANDGSYPREERAEGWHPSRKVRLFPNDPQVRFVGEVHEMIERNALPAGYQIREASFVVHHYGGLAAGPSGDQSKKRSYFELGKQKLAEQPNDLPSIGELAVQASELELYEEAIELWNRFLHLAPDASIALFNKGFALMNLNRFGEALEVTRRALEVDTLHKEAAFNYGTCALYAGDTHEAIQRLEQVLGSHPGHPPLMSILTVLYLATGQAGKARTLLQRLRQINYSVSDYIDARVSVLQSLGNQERAGFIISTMAQLNGGVNCTR